MSSLPDVLWVGIHNFTVASMTSTTTANARLHADVISK